MSKRKEILPENTSVLTQKDAEGLLASIKETGGVLTAPEGVTAIGMWAFEGCAKLRTITLPATVRRIDYCAIHDCKALRQIRIRAAAESFDEENLRILLPRVELVYI